MCSSTFNNFGDVDAVVSRDVLVADTPSDAEPETCFRRVKAISINPQTMRPRILPGTERNPLRGSPRVTPEWIPTVLPRSRSGGDAGKVGTQPG